MLWLVLCAFAWADEEILVTFQPPLEVPLPVRAGLVSGRFDSDATDCRAASVDALAQLAKTAEDAGYPYVLRLLESPTARDLSIRAACDDRREGKEVVGKTVELLALATAGPGEAEPTAASWPVLPGDLVASVVWALADLTGREPGAVGLVPIAVGLEPIGGTPGVRLAHVDDLGLNGLDVAGRAAWVIEHHVLPEVPAWLASLEPFPDIGAVEVIADVRSRNVLDRKEKRDERFRVIVRMSDAAAFVRGEITEQVLTRRAKILYRPKREAEVEVAMVVDLDAIEAPAVPVARNARKVDLDAEDAALTDEAPP